MKNQTMEKLYNTESILRSHGNDADFVKFIAQLFVENLPEMATELKKAYQTKDWYHVHFYAHKMKATIDLFSIESLKDLIREVETEGRTLFKEVETKGRAEHVPQSLNKDVEDVVKVINACTLQLKRDFAIAN